MLAIEPTGDNGGDEELRTVRVFTGVGHGEETGLGVLQLEVLIWSHRKIFKSTEVEQGVY